MNDKKETFLNLNGVPSHENNQLNKIFFCEDLLNGWSINIGDLSYEISKQIIDIDYSLTEKIFGDYKYFEDMQTSMPDSIFSFIFLAGLNSESKISKDFFEKQINTLSIDSDNSEINIDLHKFLYIADCQKLIHGIQECNQEIMQLQVEFYRSLNLDKFFELSTQNIDKFKTTYFSSKSENYNGVDFIYSSMSTKICSSLSYIFIRLYSMLDYVTKLAFELENLRSNFTIYPKLLSKNILYGNRSKLIVNNISGTLFDKCPILTQIETYRNFIIHGGFLDDISKIYQVYKQGKVVEKFILFPDLTVEGTLKSYRNRNLFYSEGNKINLYLPNIVIDFQAKLLKTLQTIQNNFNDA
jgi:hypothetical protein